MDHRRAHEHCDTAALLQTDRDGEKQGLSGIGRCVCHYSECEVRTDDFTAIWLTTRRSASFSSQYAFICRRHMASARL